MKLQLLRSMQVQEQQSASQLMHGHLAKITNIAHIEANQQELIVLFLCSKLQWINTTYRLEELKQLSILQLLKINLRTSVIPHMFHNHQQIYCKTYNKPLHFFKIVSSIFFSSLRASKKSAGCKDEFFLKIFC